MFKVGDKVYHINSGWGIVTDYTFSLMRVEFTNTVQYFEIDDKLLSFTEYTLQGFSQERPPIELPEVGEWCLVRDLDDEAWTAVIFKSYDKDEEYSFASHVNESYSQMKRIKILD